MGVSGIGKTTIGKLLSARTGWKFADADDNHSQENRQKMAAGIPLSDADRAPWLTILHERMAQYLTTAAFWPAASTGRTSTPTTLLSVANYGDTLRASEKHPRTVSCHSECGFGARNLLYLVFRQKQIPIPLRGIGMTMRFRPYIPRSVVGNSKGSWERKGQHE
jgi:hypothetical protein